MLVLLVLAGGYLLTAYLTLDAASRRVPALAAATTLLLLVFELLRSLQRRRQRLGAYDPVPPEAPPRAKPAGELAVLLSVAAFIAGIYLFGFLIALPLYLLGAIAVLGGRSWRAAVLAALLTSAGVWAAFRIVLSLRLFPGVLFS
jgi:hypothetical protein